MMFNGQRHRGRRDRRAGRQRGAQRIGHGVLTVAGGQLQDFQVLAHGGAVAVMVAQPIVGQAKVAGGEQIFAIFVVFKGARLADQRIDDVAVIDRVFAAAGQPRHGLHQVARAPDLDCFRVDHHLDAVSDQTAGNRIGVLHHLDRAAAVNLDAAQAAHVIEPRGRQVGEHLLFRGELVAPGRVTRVEALLQERFVLASAGEITAATQQERLLHVRLQMSVRRFDVAVFMRLADVDLLRLDAVMLHQLGVAAAELALFRQVVHRRAETIRAMFSRHAPHRPEGVLQSAAERFERFTLADRHALPIRVGQRAVKQQMVETLTRDRHAQRVHVGKVRSQQIARPMDLRKHHFLAPPVLAAPIAHAAFKRPPLRFGEPARMLRLQPIPQRKGAQPGFLLQSFFHVAPHIREGINPRAILARRPSLRRERLSFSVVLSCLLVHACLPCRSGERFVRR